MQVEPIHHAYFQDPNFYCGNCGDPPVLVIGFIGHGGGGNFLKSLWWEVVAYKDKVPTKLGPSCSRSLIGKELSLEVYISK